MQKTIPQKSKKKIPVILLPGLLSNHRVFHHQLQHLNNIADIKVISLTDVNSPTAMTDKILQSAPDHFALAGHSIGGWVALRIMKIAPERVMKLCLLNTAARGVDSLELASRQSALDRVKKGEFQLLASEIADRFTFNDRAKKFVLEMFLQVGELAFINQTQAMSIREDLREVLPAIHCSTLVIHAEQDQRFTLDNLTEVASMIPNATLKIVPQCGHMSPLEKPEIITELMQNWLTHE